MNKVNYDALMIKEIKRIKEKNAKPKLLLHSCCAPCSSACIERLKEHFDLTVYYYNPNIDGEEEYDKRSKEQIRLCNLLGINCIIEEFNSKEFYEIVKGFEKEREGGARCEKCFNLRLSKTIEFAKANGYDYFATTLTVSPLKNAKLINEIGEKLARGTGLKYLPSDFKKKGGYLRSIELSKEYDLYRQNYCGCEFSKTKKPID